MENMNSVYESRMLNIRTILSKNNLTQNNINFEYYCRYYLNKSYFINDDKRFCYIKYDIANDESQKKKSLIDALFYLYDYGFHEKIVESFLEDNKNIISDVFVNFYLKSQKNKKRTFEFNGVDQKNFFYFHEGYDVLFPDNFFKIEKYQQRSTNISLYDLINSTKLFFDFLEKYEINKKSLFLFDHENIFGRLLAEEALQENNVSLGRLISNSKKVHDDAICTNPYMLKLFLVLDNDGFFNSSFSSETGKVSFIYKRNNFLDTNGNFIYYPIFDFTIENLGKIMDSSNTNNTNNKVFYFSKYFGAKIFHNENDYILEKLNNQKFIEYFHETIDLKYMAKIWSNGFPLYFLLSDRNTNQKELVCDISAFEVFLQPDITEFLVY